MAVILIKWQARLKEHWYEKTVGALYEDIRVHKRSALLYNVVFVSRRMFFSAIIFVAQEYAFLQIQLLVLQSLFMAMYLIQVKPFESKLTNFLELINEFTLLGSCYHLFTITQFNPHIETQYNAGWSLIGITLLNMLINIIVMFTLTIKDLIKTFRKLKLKYKRWREKNNPYLVQDKVQNLEGIDQYSNLRNSENNGLYVQVFQPDFDSSSATSPKNTSPKTSFKKKKKQSSNLLALDAIIIPSPTIVAPKNKTTREVSNTKGQIETALPPKKAKKACKDLKNKTAKKEKKPKKEKTKKEVSPNYQSSLSNSLDNTGGMFLDNQNQDQVQDIEDDLIVHVNYALPVTMGPSMPSEDFEDLHFAHRISPNQSSRGNTITSVVTKPKKKKGKKVKKQPKQKQVEPQDVLVEDLGMNDTHMVMINFGLTKTQKQLNEQREQMSKNVMMMNQEGIKNLVKAKSLNENLGNSPVLKMRGKARTMKEGDPMELNYHIKGEDINKDGKGIRAFEQLNELKAKRN